jgi:hypothetical protein
LSIHQEAEPPSIVYYTGEAYQVITTGLLLSGKSHAPAGYYTVKVRGKVVPVMKAQYALT